MIHCEKKENLIEYVFIVSICILCLSIFIIPFGSGDELWNYNFAKQISQGKLPYKDFNMIQTPLSSYISSVFILVFGRRLFSFRIAGYVLFVSVFSVFFKLCKRVSHSVFISMVGTLFCFSLNVICFIYNYNYLSLLVVLCIILLENDSEIRYLNIKKELIIGLLFGILPLIKQSTGLILFFINIIICVLKFKYSKSSVAVRVVFSLIPGLIYFVYLLSSRTFIFFWEYAVQGIRLFTHRQYFYEYMISNPITFLFCIIFIYIIGYVLLCIIKEKSNDFKKIFSFMISLAWFFSVTFPLCDSSHFFVGIMPIVVIFLMCIKHKKYKITEKFLCAFVALFIAVFAICNVYSNENRYTLSQIKEYKYIPIEEGMEQSINTVMDFIIFSEKRGRNVLIANESSPAYTLPLNKYTKNWDMLLVGNIGNTTVDELLRNPDDTQYLLIREGFELNKQSHHELIDYIRENFRKIDEVLYFDVYEK